MAQAVQTRVIHLCALPGGGSAAYAPSAENFHAGDEVTLTSKSKGDRPGCLTAHLGTISHPFLGAMEFFAYQATK